MIQFLFHFDDELQKLHQEEMKTIVPSVASTVEPVLNHLNKILQLTLFLSPQRIHEQIELLYSVYDASSISTKEIETKYYTDLMAYYVDSAKLIEKICPTLQEIDEKSLAYFLLLRASLFYNCVVISYYLQSNDIGTVYLDFCINEFSLIEGSSFLGSNPKFCSQMRKKVVDLIVRFKEWHLKKDRENNPGNNGPKDMSLFLDEVTENVKRKNASAEEYGTSYNGIVIRNPHSILIDEVDEEAIRMLLREILKIMQEGILQESGKSAQFLLYCNQTFGSVELLNVNFKFLELNQYTLELISFSAGNSKNQHRFLRYLVQGLKYTCEHIVKFEYKILACQADMLPNNSCTHLYALQFSKILSAAQINFSALEKRALCQQPKFFDNGNRSMVDLPECHVKWFSVSALGYEAFLMAPSYKQMCQLFKKAFKEPGEATKRISYYMCKYNLVIGGLEGNQLFYQYLYQKIINVKENNSLPCLIEMMEIASRINELYDESEDVNLCAAMEKLRFQKNAQVAGQEECGKKSKKTTKTDISHVVNEFHYQAKALRRGAAGYCTLSEFKAMLEFLPTIYPSKDIINQADDGEKEQTALHVSLMCNEPKRAILLLSKGADKNKKNRQGQCAVDLYNNSKNKKINQNTKLRELLL